MWLSILSLVIGGIPAITKQIGDNRIRMAQTQNAAEKTRLEAETAELEQRRQVLVARANSPWDNVARALLLGPFLFYLATTTLWDKTMCKWVVWRHLLPYTPSCETDPLADWQMHVFLLMLAFYFGKDISRSVFGR